MVCEEVPIGRVGTMTYGPGETPVEVGRDGRAYIDREATELFSPQTLASFNGKPVTNDHPNSGVSCDNWRDLAMGYVLNPREGKGDCAGFMVADLVLTDPVIIQEVNEGKREVSSGYDNDYIQFEPGRGRQVNIIGNHVALVERGRCGSRCAIGDHKTTDCTCKGDSMAKKIIFSEFKKSIMSAFKSKDEKALTETLESLDGTRDDAGEVHVHATGKYDEKALDEKFQTHDDALEDHETRIGNLEGDDKKTGDADFKKTLDAAVNKAVATALGKLGLDAASVTSLKKLVKDAEEEEDDEDKKKKKTEDETEEEKEEREKKEKEDKAKALDEEMEKEEPKSKGAKDSIFFADNFKDTASIAEILSPGISLPTFDNSAKPVDTFKQICGLRRKSLLLASKDEDTAAIIKTVRGGKELSSKDLQLMSCDSVRGLFFATGSLKKAANNGAVDTSTSFAGHQAKKSMTIADVNKANRERYKNGGNL